MLDHIANVKLEEKIVFYIESTSHAKKMWLTCLGTMQSRRSDKHGGEISTHTQLIVFVLYVS